MQLPPIEWPPGVYADVRLEQVTVTIIAARDGDMENVVTRTITGAFLRVYRDGRWHTAATTELDTVSERLAALARHPGGEPGGPDPTAVLEVHRAEVLAYADRRVDRIELDAKRAVLDRFTPELDRPSVRTWTAAYRDHYSVRRFVSSRGADVTRDFQFVEVGATFAVGHEGDTFDATYRLGFPTFEELDAASTESLTRRVDDAERFVREAEPVEPGQYPVILAPDVAGVFAHESFGHKSEADFMLGDPEALAEWQIGSTVGSPILSICDHGDPLGTGFIPFDDEGQPSDKTWLVKDGILTGRLHSATTAAALDEAPTGNARAMSFRFDPIVRMTSTWIEPGESTVEELFAGIEHGYYIQTHRHGSGMSTFTIAPGLAWRIENGRIAAPARISVITGTVFETLRLIDGLSSEVEMHSSLFGGCGKFEQWPLPVAFGGPYVRVARMQVA